MKKLEDPKELVTPPVRLHFPSLFVKRAIPDSDKETYQAVALLPPDTDLKPFKRAMKAAVVEKFGDKFKLPASKVPIRDAAEKDVDGYEEGWRFINVNANFPPAVVDAKKQPILNEDALRGNEAARQKAIAEAESRIYAGCWVRMHLNAYAWDHKTGGKGVSFGLKAIQLVREDEPFEIGGRNTADAFDELEEDDVDLGGDDGDDEDWLD